MEMRCPECESGSQQKELRRGYWCPFCGTRWGPEETKAVPIVNDMLREARAEVVRLRALINHPHNEDWFEGVRIEAAHQSERWGLAHDDAKEPQDWFWLLGYLGGKALRACIDGDTEKAKHHTISSAAALLNWHRRIAARALQPEEKRNG